MPIIYMIYLVVVFFAVFGIAMLLMRYLAPSPVQQRLQRFAGDTATADTSPTSAWIATVAKLSSPLAKLSIPEEGWEKSVLRKRFMHAGFRDEHAPMIYF